MIPFRSCASGILLWLRILYEGNLLAFANTASRMITPFIPWCYQQHRLWPDVTDSIIWWHIAVHRGFVNTFWLAEDVIILSCPITYCWKAENFSLTSAGNSWDSEGLHYENKITQHHKYNSNPYWPSTDATWCVIFQVPLPYISLLHV